MSYWIFKCNPAYYRLADRLNDPTTDITWLVSRYKSDIAPGDIAFLMETGPNRCIRAVMNIDSAPQDLPELEHEQRYWSERDTEVKCRVIGTITHRGELLISDIRSLEGLAELSILKGFQQGTNFRVSTEEGLLLLKLFEQGV